MFISTFFLWTTSLETMRIAKSSLLATGVMSGIQGVFAQSQGLGAAVSRASVISLGGNSNVSVTLGDIKETSLLLCQTSQAPGLPIDRNNAVRITELASKTLHERPEITVRRLTFQRALRPGRKLSKSIHI